MLQNLVTSGTINPLQFSPQQALQEAAAVLQISPERIDRIECWQHQLWVNIEGVGGKLISYRRLPMWIDAAKQAVLACQTQAELNELAALFREEIRRYGKYLNPDEVERLRQVWGGHYKVVKAEEERMQSIKADSETAYVWQRSWLNVLSYCGDIDTLKRLVTEIQRQSEAFLSVKGILEPIEALWVKRWKELVVHQSIS